MAIPVDRQLLRKRIEESSINSLSTASIREIKKLADTLEKDTGEKFIRMEMGIPGLAPVKEGVDAQIEALKRGVAAIYPDIQGVPELKKEISRFVKLFLNIDVEPEHCVPTVGSMMGGFVVFMTINRMWPDREGTLFIDPGFPVQKQQCRVLGQDYMSFDVYHYRGRKLEGKLREFLDTGKVSSIMYSNPNNPTWIAFTEEELEIIGRLANEYDVVVIEDLAYFGMDFRKDYSKPGEPPYQPTVARYTDNYVLLISSSKFFSYAGERIAMIIVSDYLWDRREKGLLRYFSSDRVGDALIFGSVYSLSAGTSHSAQYALAAMLKAANDGRLNFVEYVKEYGEKAKIMKKLFTKYGFKIVYDKDLDEPIADGFYFTLSYPGMDADKLLEQLLLHGISAISLVITGSERKEGIRACTSLIQMEDMPLLEERLKIFAKNNPV